jgi:acyl-CoA hydrolase
MSEILSGKPPVDSIVEMTEVVLPSDANPLGTVFGGRVVQWIDICATVAAQRHCRQIVVTASMDDLHFLAPIHVGMIALIRATVTRAWRTSVEVEARVDSEDPLSGERRHCVSAYLTFVALGPDGRPTPVPPVIPQTADELRRYEAADERRRQRLARAALWRHAN